MTEAEWLACEDGEKIVNFAACRGSRSSKELLHWFKTFKPASHRKHKLFACACCHRILKWLVSERSRKVLAVVEAVADQRLPLSEETKARAIVKCCG